MTLLALHDIRGGYGEVDILNGISLSVAQGEVLTIAGTNGAGKSTLAKAALGLLPRVTGRVVLDGRDISALSVEARVASGLGYVPQVENIFRSLTVEENLRVTRGFSPARREALFALFPALASRARQRAGALSGGERQQLAFARALVAEPRILLLDEPTAALSPARAGEVFGVIARLPATGVSVVMVEQRARQALAISDRGCILDGGKIALEGSARALLADERAADLFLGRHG